MKRIIQTTIFLFMLLSATAQETEADSLKRAREREIKTSGLYLYGEAVHPKKNEAIKLAKQFLTTEINKEIMERPNWQFAKQIEAKDVEYSTEHIDLVRGSRVRAIAYIRKDSLKVLFDKSAPAINLVDKQEKKEKKKTEKQVKESEELSQPQSEQPERQVTVTDNPILNELLTARDVKKASVLLTKYKSSGKLIYGKPDTNTSPAQSYLMIYNRQGEIVALLDKGASNERKDLFSGEVTTAQSFPSTSYIWFQIFE